MTELYSGANAQMNDVWYGLLALIPILWAFYRKLIDRPVSLWIPGLALLLGVMASSIAVWDVMRVRTMLRTGEGLHVTRGIITNAWHIVSRPRDWTKTSLAYKTVVSEGFDIGGERFSWVVGGGYTAATFSNLANPKIRFANGMNVEVTWFEDAAEKGMRRIVKLAVAKPIPSASGTGDPPAKAEGAPLPASKATVDFVAFRADFVRAVQSGNRDRTKALTQLPFLFGGNAIAADEFDTLWNGLFTPFVRDCLARAEAIKEADGSRAMFCGETIFMFRRNAADNWRFSEIGAND